MRTILLWRQVARVGTMRAPTGLGRGGRDQKSPPRGFLFFERLNGPLGPFCFLTTTMPATLRERLIALIEPLVGRLGYELVELEHTAGRGSAVVRLFIDSPEGVGLADCERVSREVSALLDVEDPIPTAYTLEVSSPGFDRLLRTPAHFARFVGSRVAVELAVPREGRRRYTGTLLSADEAGIVLEVDGEHVAMSFSEIGKARLTGESER
jgi:ribosome maturation factor RimP